MCNTTNIKTDIALLVARIGLGGMMLLHGIAKLSGDLSWLKAMLAGKGFPEMLAYGVYVGEIIVPVMLIIGLAARPAAVIFIINMAFAVALAHGNDVLALNAQTGGWAIELPALYILGALVIVIAGPGKFAIPCPLCKFLKGKCSCSEDASCSCNAEK